MSRQKILICSLHDDIAQLGSEILQKEGVSKEVKRMAEEIVELAGRAKERGQSMEDRLREYHSAITSIGFKRVKTRS